jgi:hypothetical protein
MAGSFMLSQFQFSHNLIGDTIKCFKEENNLELTPEKANEYLHSLAGLYLAFAGGGKRPTTSVAAGTPPALVEKVECRGYATLGVSNT